MTSFDDIRKKATRPTRTVSLCVAGELVEQLEQLERQLQDTPAPESLADTRRKDLAEEILAKQAEMREATVEFKLRALPGREWTFLFARQPVREEKETDEAWEARAWAYQAEVVARTVEDPPMTVEEVGELCDMLHGRAWMQLVGQAMILNNGQVDVPNSVAASELTGDSGTR